VVGVQDELGICGGLDGCLYREVEMHFNEPLKMENKPSKLWWNASSDLPIANAKKR
jgi:hypothetical protein